MYVFISKHRYFLLGSNHIYYSLGINEKQHVIHYHGQHDAVCSAKTKGSLLKCVQWPYRVNLGSYMREDLGVKSIHNSIFPLFLSENYAVTML